jgi:DHA2 family multidrug resistance protein-like MFS transporter
MRQVERSRAVGGNGSSDPGDVAATSASAAAPQRAGLVLAALILVAAVANLNLAVANVALPSIGQAFGSSQTELDLIAVGYSLGLAASVPTSGPSATDTDAR